jgi:hypothetical protein
MKILSRDELDEQRKNYIGFVRALNKLAKGVEDETLKGEKVRDMNLILQTRFLTFILSELVHMGQILRVMEDQIEVDFLKETEVLSEDEFDDVFESQIEKEANGYDPISKQDRDAEEADRLTMDADEVLKALTMLDDDGLDEARRLLNEIYRRAEQDEDEESD